MNTELDQLVVEFEMNKLEAIDARAEFMGLSCDPDATQDEIVDSQSRWLRLQVTCRALLRSIDRLAERNAA